MITVHRVDWASRVKKGLSPHWAGALVLSGVGAAMLVLAGAALPARAAQEAAAEPASTGGELTFRRLNESQYKQSIEDIFGAGIKVPGRFDPDVREDGLLAVGSGHVTVSASGLEQYELRARDIAAQVLAEDKRKTYLSCAPAAPTAFDTACATQFLSKYGRMLYRRPLTKAELASVLGVASAGATTVRDFHKGLEIGLARLLYSPNFVFRVETGEPDPSRRGATRLAPHSLASRISFLLWNAPPDEQLLAAADDGTLRQPKVLEAQVDRLIGSPRFAAGVRAFFSDLLMLNQFEGLSKDQAIFPKFTAQMAKDSQEQVLRTVVDLLVTNNGDYRDLFTTQKTFLNRNLGALYDIPIQDEAGIEGWVPYTFAPSDRRGGLLTLAGMLMLDPSHEGRSSPTNRGKLVREALMCQKVPDPPANVNFAAVQDIDSKLHPTARKRLTIHMENPVCAGCHALTDPIGLAMENYDALGAFRSHENGEQIDASGKFEGTPYNGVLELQKLIHASPNIPACLVQRTYEYGVGRSAAPGEMPWLEYSVEAFGRDNYRLPALMRRIALSGSFQAVSAAPLAGSKVATR